MRFKTFQSVPAGTNAQANLNGNPFPVGYMTRISAQFVVAGVTTVSATGKVQVSDDIPPDGTDRLGAFTPTNWSDLPNATIAINANATFLVPPTEVCARWARLVYVFTSGTGAGTVQGNAHTLAAAGQG